MVDLIADQDLGRTAAVRFGKLEDKLVLEEGRIVGTKRTVACEHDPLADAELAQLSLRQGPACAVSEVPGQIAL